MSTRRWWSWLGIGAALSACLTGVLVCSWTGLVKHSGCTGWSRLRESTPERFVVDDYTAQLGLGGLWIGCCRTSLDAGPIMDVLSPEIADKMRVATTYIDVFSIETLTPELRGLGKQKGLSTEVTAIGRVLRFEVDGWLLPHWLLLIATSLLPIAWIVRRVRARHTVWDAAA